jgi:hypothetical protein
LRRLFVDRHRFISTITRAREREILSKKGRISAEHSRSISALTRCRSGDEFTGSLFALPMLAHLAEGRESAASGEWEKRAGPIQVLFNKSAYDK